LRIALQPAGEPGGGGNWRFHGFPHRGGHRSLHGGPGSEHIGPGSEADAIVETLRCLPDAVQLFTPCSLGNGWMRVLDWTASH